jgi:putative membrane protein
LVDQLSHLSADGRDKVHRALEALRNSTSAKFELVVVPASERYALYPVVWAALAALTVTAALAMARPWLAIGTGVILNAALFIVLTLVLDWWPLRMMIVPASVKRAAAGHLAHREFAVRLVASGPPRNGVLLFASLAEHHLEIVADREAHVLVPEGTWDKIVADATAAMSARGAADGLAVAIAGCAAALAKAFPKTPT